MSTHHEFDGDWLSLREAADHAARPQQLADALNRFFAHRPALRIVDLGAGHGNNLRWLAPRLTPAQRWLLVDRDRRLLEQAAQLPRPSSAPLQLETLETDLAISDLGFVDGHDLVTASALFDLVSADWLRRLVDVCHGHRCAVLFALSVTGKCSFLDAESKLIETDDDILARDLFNHHQHQDKGLGAALGPDAAQQLPEILELAGYSVQTAVSDWQLAAGTTLARALGPALLHGWAEAAVEAGPDHAPRLARWQHQRLDGLISGQLGVSVGHVDVLGLPAS